MSRHFFTILLLLVSVVSYGRKPGVARFYSRAMGGLCSGTIELYIDNSYVYESGCEESSHVSFGSWQLVNDTLSLKPIDNKTFKVIDTIISSHIDGDSISVTILDKDGVNITNKVDMKLADLLTLDHRFYSKAEPDAERFEPGTDSISLYSLERIFDQVFAFLVGDNNCFVVKLNIPSAWLFHPSSDWGGFGEFQLLRTANSLVTFTPHFPVRQIFAKPGYE